MIHRPRATNRPPGVSRRRVLGFGAAAVASTVLPPIPADAAVPGRADRRRAPTTGLDELRPAIRPRADWAGTDLGVKGQLVAEDDVRFLLVHHTASPNDYGPDDVVSLIRGFYDFHTGPEKEWPDVAYNFLIDRFGTIWEARDGSIAGPVRGDATGGSQGFALLCCLIGNHAEEPPTADATNSLVQLLAWLGTRHEIDTNPGATVTFDSRGSSLWPAGDEVVAATISGHRDMSSTSCPGDFGYALVTDELPGLVTAAMATAPVETTTTSTSTSTEDSTATSTAGTGAPTTGDTERAAAVDTTTGAELTIGTGEGEPSDDRSTPLIVTGVVAGAIAAVGAGLNRLRGRAET